MCFLIGVARELERESSIFTTLFPLFPIEQQEEEKEKNVQRRPGDNGSEQKLPTEALRGVSFVSI